MHDDFDSYQRAMKLGSLGALLSTSDGIGLPASLQEKILYQMLEAANLKSNPEELGEIHRFYLDKHEEIQQERAMIKKANKKAKRGLIVKKRGRLTLVEP